MPRLSRRALIAGVAAVSALPAAVASAARAAATAPDAKRTLGRNGIEVSAVGLGCNNFGMRLDYAGTERVVHAAVDMGVTLFDTADVYGRGVSEEYLGKALGPRRAKVVIATKFGSPMGAGPFPQGGGSRAAIMSLAEDSLRRLGTDVIDLYQYHRPDGVTPMEETLRALDDLVKQGKVRAIGHSNFTAAQARECAAISANGKLTAYATAQNHYSLLTRDIEAELVPACEELGLGVLPFFPLESGMLTGKYKRDEKPAEGTRMAAWSANPAAAERFMNDAIFTKVEKLTAIADGAGVTLLDMAFGWLLSKPYISSVIAGATRPEQIEANVKAAAWRPTADIDRAIDAVTKSA
ncbi:MAG: aldo/keto reductase [Rhodospirillaceae bacterium]|nr:aldo/keto reductase [Rhodospirillaceae bacterium]